MGADSENIKIECAENCGNSPKKQLLKDFTIALAKSDINFCMNWITDDVVWDIVGDQQIQGIGNYEQRLNGLKDQKVIELHIHNIITHGNTASVNATILLQNNHRVAFCDVYNFRGFGKNAKIKAITSYVIKIS